MSTERFISEYLECYEDADRRVPVEWLDTKGTHTLRDPSPVRLIDYWMNRHVPLQAGFFAYEREHFRESIGLSPMAYIYTVPDSWRSLAGIYQIIRPHAVTKASYVCEVMEIEIRENIVTTLFYSNDHVNEKYMYQGIAHPAERYYFSLMSRPHENVEGRRAYRAISLYVGEGRYDGCLTGLMVKGMRGIQTGKELTALPLIALPMHHDGSLRKLDIVPVHKPDRYAEQLYFVHSASNALIGDVAKKTYPKIFNWINKIFADEAVADSIKKPMQAVYSIPPGILKENEAVSAKKWEDLMKGLRRAPVTNDDGISS